jgi:Molybdopterin oxidoreductase N-terminal domain
MTSGRTTVHTGSHWGLYDAEVENGQVIGVRACSRDPRPSRIIEAMPGAAWSPLWRCHGTRRSTFSPPSSLA